MTTAGQLTLTRPPTAAGRLLASARSPGVVSPGLDGYRAALAADVGRMYAHATPKPLSELRDWHAAPGSDVIRHGDGHFFTVEGLAVAMSGPASARRWQQPIIVQSEVGLLGIIAREFDGVLHFLMQNKAEPGNRNGIQLSPTVQATRSNFRRVHGGNRIPYLSYFLDPNATRSVVLTDVRQSEHGSWFLGKRNRNMVVEVFDEVPVAPGFTWLTLGQIAALMRIDDLVNMETRSVLSCLPYADERRDECGRLEPHDDGFSAALQRSCHADQDSLVSPADLTSWITRARFESPHSVSRLPLGDLDRWSFGSELIAHDEARYFQVVGVDVEAGGREVRRWDQPMVAAGDGGVVALIVRSWDGVLHVLVQLRAEAGNADGPEISPSVQCRPRNYDGPGALPKPPLLDRVLAADPEEIRYDTMLSDEGGRFFEISHRHLIVECDDVEAPSGYRWVTMRQLSLLLQHSNYLNVQSRSVVACLQSLLAPEPPKDGTWLG